MAMAEAHLAARYNRPGFEIIDHFTYAIVSDGDLMEGVASEAASLAGHLRLGKLVCLYDNNHVTLSAGTDITFTEDCARRFEAYGWHTAVGRRRQRRRRDRPGAARARDEAARPSLILVRTHLGYGSPHKQDTFEAHGSPLGADEVRLTKQNSRLADRAGVSTFRSRRARIFARPSSAGRAPEAEWNARFAAYAKAFPRARARIAAGACAASCPRAGTRTFPSFRRDAKGMATRVAAGKVMNAIARGCRR